MKRVGGGIKTANNLAVTEEGFALDARQGKVLNEKIEKVDGNLLLPFRDIMSNDADFNDYKTHGWYNNAGTNGQVNTPHRADNGRLLVFSWDINHVRQIWIGYFAMVFMTRHYIDGTWSEWKSFKLE